MNIKVVAVFVVGIMLGVVAMLGLPLKQDTGSSSGDKKINTSVEAKWLLQSKQVAYVLPNDGPYYDLKWHGVSSELKKMGYDPQKYSAGGYKGVKKQVDIIAPEG